MKIKNRKKYLFIFFLFFLPFCLFGQSNRVVAVVNNEIITARDLARYRRMVSGRGVDGSLLEEKESLERLIEDRLILQLAEEENIEVPQSWLGERIRHLASAYPDFESFSDSLEEQGLSLSCLEKRLKEQYLIREVVNRRVRAEVSILPGQISQHYQENIENYRASPRVFFLMASKKDKDSLEEIKAFIELAGIETARDKFKDDLLEFDLHLNQLQEALKNALQGLGDGSQTIFKMGDSYHLIYRKKIELAQNFSLNEVQKKVYADLWQNEFNKKFDGWISSLREEAVIRIYSSAALRE